jgi:uncharacterized protein with GYD domain
MATYIVLNTFTEQGIRTIKDTVSRADAVRESARKFGVTVKDIYWTLGEYDVVALFDAPDDASMTAFTLALGAQGNVKTQMLRGLTRDEMRNVLAKMQQAREAVPA